MQNRITSQLGGYTQYYQMTANEWKRLVFIDILDNASKVVFLTIIFKNVLFFPAKVNRNLPYKQFVIAFFVDFEILFHEV